MKNQVSFVMILSNKKYPRNATGIFVRDPTIACVVGPVTDTQLNDAKFKKKPTKPAKKFFVK